LSKVPRGGKFGPYQKIDGYSFFGRSPITPATFRAARARSGDEKLPRAGYEELL
jgi:hypothetical protein